MSTQCMTHILYLWLYLIDSIILWVLVQFHTASDLIIFVDNTPIFPGQAILPCISHRIKYEGIILLKSDTVNDLILFTGHCGPIFHGPMVFAFDIIL